jgi:hypothetical protein
LPGNIITKKQPPHAPKAHISIHPHLLPVSAARLRAVDSPRQALEERAYTTSTKESGKEKREKTDHVKTKPVFAETTGNHWPPELGTVAWLQNQNRKKSSFMYVIRRESRSRVPTYRG